MPHPNHQRLRRACALAAAALTTSLSLAQTATWALPTSGVWSDPANWSTNPDIPNSPSTDAVIAATGSPYTVAIDIYSLSLQSLQIASPDATVQFGPDTLNPSTPINLSAGTLYLSGSYGSSSLKKLNQTGGTLFLAGSVLIGSVPLNLTGTTILKGSFSSGLINISPGAPVSIESGNAADINGTYFNNVVLAGNLAVNATLTLQGTNALSGTISLNLTGGVLFPPRPSILFYNSTTLTAYPPNPSIPNVGTILFNAPNSTIAADYSSTTASLTIGPSYTIKTGIGSGTIGSSDRTNVPVLNQGTIAADAPGLSVTVYSYPLTNQGTLRATSGGSLVIPNLANAATGSLAVSNGSSFSLSPASGQTWSNAGSFTATSATLALSGAGTTSGSITANASSLTLAGSWTNAGTLTATNSAVSLAGTWSNPGSISLTGGSLTLTGTWTNAGTIAASAAAVTINSAPSATTNLSFPNSTVSVSANFTAAQLLTNSPGASFTLNAGANLTNTGNTITLSASIPTITLAGATITGGAVTTPDATPLTAVTGNSTLTGVTLSAPLNILSPAAVNLSSGSSSSTLSVPAGATLTLSNSVTTTGTIAIAPGGTLALGGPFFPATPIPLTSAKVRITGSVPYASVLNSLNPTSSTFTLASGTLDLGGATFAQTPDNPWTFTGGGLANGTFSGGLTIPASNFALNNITLTAQPTFSPGTLLLSVSGTLTLDNVNYSMPAGIINGGDSAIIAGAGSISFDSITTQPIIRPIGTTLTIGPNVTIKTGLSSGTVGSASRPLLNKGTLAAQTPGQSLTVTGSNWTSTGTLAASNSSTLTLAGSFTTAGMGAVSTSTGGSVVIAGSLNNSNSTLPISAASSNLSLGPGGTITGGFISTPDNSPLNVLPASGTLTSTLSGVNVYSPVALQPGAVLRAPGTNFALPFSSSSATFNLSAGPFPIFLSSATFADSTINVTTPLSFTSLLANFVRANTPINLSSPVTNTGLTIPVSAATGPLNILSSSSSTSTGSVTGGTLGTSPDGLIILGTAGVSFSPSVPYLDNITLAASLIVPSAVTADARNTLTLTNGARITLLPGPNSSTPTRLRITNLEGAGEIIFDGTPTSSFITESLSGANGTTVNIPASVTVRTGANSGSINGGIISGTISAQTAGQSIALFSNAIGGTVEAKNGGSVTLSYSAPSPSFLTGPTTARTLAAGIWSVADASNILIPTSAFSTTPATITTNATTITLAGLTSRFDAINPLATNNGSLTLTNGRTFTTASNLTNTGTLTLGPSSALKITGSLSNPGTLSLTGGSLLIDYTGPSPIDTLRNDLLTHHLVTPLPNTAIAYVEASQLSPEAAGLLAAGLPTDSTTLLTKLTVAGDANLSGSIDPDDYTLLDRALATATPNPHWTDGDFNYDGIINDQDYLLIDTSYLSTHSPSPTFLADRESQFGSQYVSTLLASTPEPASLFAACGLAFPTLRPRRHRR